MNTPAWFERNMKFGLPKEMLPFYIERLDGTIARLEKKIMGIDDRLLSEMLNNKWSVKQNIGHLAEVDEVANKRIDEMISRGSTPSTTIITWSKSLKLYLP